MKPIYYTLIACLVAGGLLFTACTSDSIDTITPEKKTTTGLVSLKNKTSLKLNSTSTRVVYNASFADASNPACDLTLQAVPDMPSDTKKVNEVSDFGSNTNRDFAVNIDNTENNKYEFPLVADVFLTGKATISNMWGNAGKDAKVYVTQGGELFLNTATLTGHVVSEGKLNIVPKKFCINHESSIYVKGDLELQDLSLIGDLYVSGNLKAQQINVNNGARLHVGGDLILTGDKQNTITNNANVAVEGALRANLFNMDSNSKLYGGCSVFVKKLTLHNKSVITALYIEADETEISATTINLPNQGVANLGNTTIGSVENLKFNVVGDGEAMVVTNNCYLEQQYSLTNNIGGNIYFNYNHFFVKGKGGHEEVTMPGQTADKRHTVEIGTDFVNQGTPNAWKEGDCNPGFTKNNSEPSTPPTEPSDPIVDNEDEIVVTIPTDIKREWFIEADDFAIRVDGEYMENVIPVDNLVEMDNVKISERNLTVSVGNVSNLDFTNPEREYTYELWIWVKEDSWNAFTEAEREFWVSGDGHGTNITDACGVKVPEGYALRYNVYKGLGGQQDTPYIKVSIHVNKAKPRE